MNPLNTSGGFAGSNLNTSQNMMMNRVSNIKKVIRGGTASVYIKRTSSAYVPANVVGGA
jgi:hypothetical protein